MGENSKIEWTHHTFNPWVGCTKVSPACDNCYAEAWAKRTGHPELWEGERRRTSLANWNQPMKWDATARRLGKRHRVFCASLADVFDNQVPCEWRADLWHLIDATPHLDWLLLTKRPQNIRKMLPRSWMGKGTTSFPTLYPNMWLGTTCEDQEHYEMNYGALCSIGAIVRFVSYEPALGPLTLAGIKPLPDWIICGGESGSKARMMDPEWARSLRDQCEAAGTPFFMKQMTKKQPIPEDLLVRKFPEIRRP